MRIYKIPNIDIEIIYHLENTIDNELECIVVFITSPKIYIYGRCTDYDIKKEALETNNILLYFNYEISNIKIKLNESEIFFGIKSPQTVNLFEFEIKNKTTKISQSFTLSSEENLSNSHYMEYIIKMIDFCKVFKIDFTSLSQQFLNSEPLNIITADEIDILSFINFEEFRISATIKDVIISNFYDKYIREAVYNSFKHNLDLMFPEITFSSIENQSSRLVIKKSTQNNALIRAKILFHFKKNYDINNHIKSYLY